MKLKTVWEGHSSDSSNQEKSILSYYFNIMPSCCTTTCGILGLFAVLSGTVTLIFYDDLYHYIMKTVCRIKLSPKIEQIYHNIFVYEDKKVWTTILLKPTSNLSHNLLKFFMSQFDNIVSSQYLRFASFISKQFYYLPIYSVGIFWFRFRL